VAYVRLEEARLRCERLAAQASTEADYVSLRRIHRELGMAGWLAGNRCGPSARAAEQRAATIHATDAVRLKPNSTHRRERRSAPKIPSVAVSPQRRKAIACISLTSMFCMPRSSSENICNVARSGSFGLPGVPRFSSVCRR
jgi:hypothetical protein